MVKQFLLVTVVSALLLVVIGCSTNSEQPDSNVPMPDLEATVHARVQGELDKVSSTPAPAVISPTPARGPIENGSTCILTGGEIVEEGWSGKDTGSNSCNQCRCMLGGLACTKMACAPTMKPTPTTVRPILTVLSISTPPYKGTLLIRNSSEIINESDPTLFGTLTKISDNPRKMFDRRNGWITITPFLFEATFTDGQSIEVQVNPEFESVQIAREITLIYLGPIGKLPAVLRQDVETIWLHNGKEPFGGGNNNLLIHHEKGLEYIRGGILEEAFLHEASHTSLDPYYYNNNWEAVQKADGNFISTHARDYPTREDVAESFPMYYALRYKPSRISYSLRDTIPNRVMYFDENLPDFEPTLPSSG